jgi:mannose-6-phosphate isomerase-like protein (cupin superfamily)
MSNLKYADRLVTDVGFKATHVMKVDQNRLPDFMSVDCTWFWRSQPNQIVDGTRISAENQVIGLIGAYPEDPFSLAGEMTVWIDGKKNILKKSSLIFVPAGVPFGPAQINHMEHPIFYTTMGVRPDPREKRDPNLPRYTIVSETKEKAVQPPAAARRTLKGTRLLHMEDDMAKGSFYVDFVWFYEGYGQAPAEVHDHEWPELMVMTGCDPEHPYDVGGTFSVALGDETHYINKSTLICIPAHVMHCPWKFLEVKKPTLAFTASPSGMYYSSEKGKW